MSLIDKIKREHESPTVKVPPRQDNLISPTEVEAIKSEVITEKEVEPMKSEVLFDQHNFYQHESLDASLVSSLEKELKNFPAVCNKKIGVRIEEEIYEGIRDLCYNNGITVETLLEAYFTLCKSQPRLLEKIIKEAQARIKRRTRAGNIRSLITKTKNL
ncbi:hypothetical protein [Cylindrospermopsis raciborskii]|uniref:hypothetical protein n=1 Tax=Cylindrospermopsis raciborskii TaxID=77022 RepID=UPI0022BE28E5|nr:hypothetical protein [Cylindrospermopsis raciborskii]MCZ2207597.1 hypothetical protein [Cylindrospermopsis raciborskii PAMP2011]